MFVFTAHSFIQAGLYSFFWRDSEALPLAHGSHLSEVNIPFVCLRLGCVFGNECEIAASLGFVSHILSK